MANIARPEQETLIALGKSSFDEITLARVNNDNLADRIAKILDERRRIAEMRRQREQERLLSQAERDQAGARKRGEAKGPRLLKELDALYETVISSNAADEVMKEHGIQDAA